MKRLSTSLAVIIALSASGAAAKPRLGDQPTIQSGLFEVAIAYEISEVCPSIKARLFAGMLRLNALRSEAARLGYTSAEIDAFMDDDAEKSRLEGLARQRLDAMGAIPGNAQSHCDVGRAEMAAGTRIGQLLR